MIKVYNSYSKKCLEVSFLSRKKDKYYHYYGIPHSHTSYSSGKGTPTEAFKYAKNKKIDYLIITDHTSKFSSKSSNKINKWESTIDECTKFNKSHKHFCALYGFECGSKMFGHLNIYNTTTYFNGLIKDKETLYKRLEEINAIACINHPSKNVLKVQYDERLDKRINLVEIGNGAPPYKYSRYEDIVFGLLDKGWHLGIVNGQDNHKENWGEQENLTVIISKNLRREEFMEAIMYRRVYSTESKHLKMSFKINSLWMGSVVDKNKFNKLEINIELEDKKKKITEIQIISNKNTIIECKKYDKKSSVKETFIKNIETEKRWYLLKVIQDGDKIAYSSPIFVE